MLNCVPFNHMQWIHKISAVSQHLEWNPKYLFTIFCTLLCALLSSLLGLQTLLIQFHGNIPFCTQENHTSQPFLSPERQTFVSDFLLDVIPWMSKAFQTQSGPNRTPGFPSTTRNLESTTPLNTISINTLYKLQEEPAFFLPLLSFPTPPSGFSKSQHFSSLRFMTPSSQSPPALTRWVAWSLSLAVLHSWSLTTRSLCETCILAPATWQMQKSRLVVLLFTILPFAVKVRTPLAASADCMIQSFSPEDSPVIIPAVPALQPHRPFCSSNVPRPLLTPRILLSLPFSLESFPLLAHGSFLSFCAVELPCQGGLLGDSTWMNTLPLFSNVISQSALTRSYPRPRCVFWFSIHWCMHSLPFPPHRKATENGSPWCLLQFIPTVSDTGHQQSFQSWKNEYKELWLWVTSALESSYEIYYFNILACEKIWFPHNRRWSLLFSPVQQSKWLW